MSRRAIAAITGVVAATLVLVVGLTLTGGPSTADTRALTEAVIAPVGAAVIDRTDLPDGGCGGRCPATLVTYRFRGTPREAAEAFADALTSAGFGVAEGAGPSLLVERATPDLDLLVTIGEQADGITPVTLTASGRSG